MILKVLICEYKYEVMFVGGPNKRRDFHLDRGSEFFYQIRGDMKLPIIIGDNDLRIVTIKEGEVFCLPSCVLHSPQRLSETSLGMVIERERYPDEPDGLRFFRTHENIGSHERNITTGLNFEYLCNSACFLSYRMYDIRFRPMCARLASTTTHCRECHYCYYFKKRRLETYLYGRVI